MNPLLHSISLNAADDLKSLIESGNDDILNAIHKVQAEAMAQQWTLATRPNIRS